MHCVICVFFCSCYVVSTSASDLLEKFVSKMTNNVLMG